MILRLTVATLARPQTDTLNQQEHGRAKGECDEQGDPGATGRHEHKPAASDKDYAQRQSDCGEPPAVHFVLVPLYLG